MKTSVKLIATFAAVCLLSANVALAKNGGNGNGNKGGNGGNNGNKNSGFKLNFGGTNGVNLIRNNNNGNYNNGNCHNNGNYNNNGYCNNYNQYNQNFGQGYEPFHSSYVVLPGDSFYTVSLKEYGTSANARHIARFNNLPQNSALVLGRTLMLPSISPNGTLSMSRAPAAESLQGTFNNGVSGYNPNFTGPTSGVTNNFVAKTTTTTATTPIVEESRPKVTVGSTLLVDGQSFGDKQGAARLRVSGLSLPIEVLEWNTSSVKIHLPTVELTSATKADIEVLRADGTLASKSAVELGAATEVAATK
jgi:hypothetical protein